MNFKFRLQVFVFILGVIVVVVYTSYFLMGSHEDPSQNLIFQQKYEQRIREDIASLKTTFEKELSSIADEIEVSKKTHNTDEYQNEMRKLSQLIDEVKAMENQIQTISSETVMLKEKIDQMKVIMDNRSTSDDNNLDTFIIKSEIDKLKTIINDRPRNEEKKTSLPEGTKLLLLIPGFGPNNQYMGMMDCMFIAKQLGRVFVRPDFYLHAVNDLDSIRTFDFSFQSEPMNQYVPTTSVQEAIRHCGEIDSIVWLRDPAQWLHLVKLYMKHLGMNYKNVVYTPNNDHLFFTSYNYLQSYFSKMADQKCIALCFPYSSVYYSQERAEIAKYLIRSQYIKNVVKTAFEEMGTKPENLLSIHWRFGEDSCAWYSSPDKEYDFCWGTAVFHFAKVSDVLFVLLDFIKNANVTHVYIAVASHYLDPKVMKQIENEFAKENIPYFRSRDVPSLSMFLYLGWIWPLVYVPDPLSLEFKGNITDNYYLSLAEQELCSTSRLFCRSDSSTWSDYIVNWVKYSEVEYPTIVSLGELLKKHGKPYSTWSREANEAHLKKFRRPEGWNKER